MIDQAEIAREAEACRERMVSFRRQFHSWPELGLSCHKTAATVADYLESLGLSVTRGLAESGVVGLLTGDLPGPTIALRVDMDALPLTEETGLAFASQRPGMMHACGHDGHTAIGLGVASILTRFKNRLAGTVKFIFQPGEESPGGAKLMVRDGVLRDPETVLALGVHIHPGFERGTMSFCRGTSNAGDISFEALLNGKGGHAARPYQCRDPIIALGRLIADFQTLSARQSDPLDPVVISIAEIQGGKGHNIIPDTVALKGTIRYLSQAARQRVLDGIGALGTAMQQALGVDFAFRIVTEDPPMKVDDELGAFLEGEARKAWGAETVVPVGGPSMGAEDFAWFTREIPCAYLKLGAYDPDKGHTADLHNSHFDFDEDVLVTGAAVMAFLITKALDFPGYSGNPS